MNRQVIIYIFALIFSLTVGATQGCGGGGGGGGAGGGGGGHADPVVNITSPTSSTFKTNNLPSTVSFNYSDSDGIDTGTAKAVFTFQGISFDLSELLSATTGSASASPDTSPLNWTIASKYNASTGAHIADYKVFGSSSGASSEFSFIEIDPLAGVLVIASTTRQKMLYINSSTGAAIREISLASSPKSIRSCPAHGKVLVSLDGSSAISIYSITTGSLSASVPLGAEPSALAVNKQTSTAYAVFPDQSKTLAIIDCADNSVTTSALDYEPNAKVIETDGAATGNLYYVGGTGDDRGIYLYGAGSDTKVVSLPQIFTDLNPGSIALDSSTGRISGAYYADDVVLIYDLSDGSTTAQRPVGDKPFSVVAAPSAGRFFSLNKGSDSVSVINSSSGALAATINLASDPLGMVVDDTNSHLYVLQNIWEITTSESASLNVSVDDSKGNTGAASMNLTVEPVSQGGPAPTTPD